MANRKPDKVAWCSSCGYFPPHMNPAKNDIRDYVGLHLHFSGKCSTTGEPAHVEPKGESND